MVHLLKQKLEKQNMANDLAEACGADVVGVVGRKVILYRESVNNKRIEL